jgi:hypothetical protein
MSNAYTLQLIIRKIHNHRRDRIYIRNSIAESVFICTLKVVLIIDLVLPTKHFPITDLTQITIDKDRD